MKRIEHVAPALLFALFVGCGGKTAEDTTDACTTCSDGSVPDEGIGEASPRPDTDIPPTDLGPPPPIDAGPPPPSDCFGPLIDPTNPPIGCGPDPGIPRCSSVSPVASCPTDSACMARVMPTGTTLDFRVGRLRLHAPDALLSLTALAFDPNVNPKCDNGGAESLNWMMRFDTAALTLLTGGAVKSIDGVRFGLTHEKVDTAALDAICPGFKGSPTPIDLSPVATPLIREADGSFTSGAIARLNIPIYEGSVPLILPLCAVQIRHAKISSDGACIGGWDRSFWCDGDTLGWTTGGAILAKILVEDADHVPVKTAGCQSLCAILANDASKVTGKVCKRGADGKIPPIGDATVATSGDAFLLSATFGAYGVTIAP